MKLTNYLATAFMAVFLCVAFTGCTTFEALEDFVSDNPVLTQIAARQAVGHYIAKGRTVTSENKRALDVHTRITKYLAFIDGNPQTTINQLSAVIKTSIPWDKLTPSDRMLVTDIVGYIEAELRRSKPEDQGISEETTFAIKTLLQTAADTAQLYLDR